MSISVLGDGCRYCQPQEYIDSLERVHKENDELLETCEDLETQLAETREDVKKAVKQGFDALCGGGFCPITFDEFWARSEFNRLKEKGDE